MTPTQIGSEVVVEDDAIVHGCILGDAVLVERDATVLTGSSVGEGSIVQAGALVPEGKSFPARSVIAGTPGKVIRETTDDEVAARPHRCEVLPRRHHGVYRSEVGGGIGHCHGGRRNAIPDSASANATADVVFADADQFR